MDLQTRKINFIQDFLKIESEKVISQFEKLLKKETPKNPDLNPMSVEDFQKRIQSSSSDVKKGNLTESKDLISEIEEWS